MYSLGYKFLFSLMSQPYLETLLAALSSFISVFFIHCAPFLGSASSAAAVEVSQEHLLWVAKKCVRLGLPHSTTVGQFFLSTLVPLYNCPFQNQLCLSLV